MSRKAKYWPLRGVKEIYSVLLVVFVVMLALVVIGVATSVWWLVAISAVVIFVLAAVVGAVAYRRIIRSLRQTHRNTLLALEESRKNHVKPSTVESPRGEVDLVSTSDLQGHSLGALEWWSLDAGLDSSQLVQRLTIVRSVKGRDIMAKMATKGHWTWNELARALEAYRLGGSPRHTVLAVLSKSDFVRVAQLADLCYRQNCLPQDFRNAATLYLLAYEFEGATNFKKKKRVEFFLDALLRSGLPDEFNRYKHLLSEKTKMSGDYLLFEANGLNPGKDSSNDAQLWLDTINSVYSREGLARLSLREGPEPAFLRLQAEKTKKVTAGPLVSIVMPVFKPDGVTDLAIQSALDQSYENIEIIIIDDGSGSGYEERLEKWQHSDSHVSVIFNEKNSGAYTSRNMGFEIAKGKYITVFDGDDWQHPQKIAKLVEASEKASDFQLVSTPWVRVDEDILFQYRGWRGLFVTPSHVSNMFPTAVIREKLGYWDTVRKAADTEYILRYQLAINPEEPVEATSAPMTLSLVGESNLSMEDFRLGYRSPDRVSYRASYEHWHKAIKKGEASPYMEFPLQRRKFPAPGRFTPARASELALDLLLVGDFSRTSSEVSVLEAQLAQARKLNLRIGVCQVKSILTAPSMESAFEASLMDAIAAGEIHRVQITDPVIAKTVIAYEPTAFQFAPVIASAVVAENLYISACEPPYDASKKRHAYEVFTVTDNLHGLFKTRPVWVPGNDLTQNTLRQVLADNDILFGKRQDLPMVKVESNLGEFIDVIQIMEHGSDRLIHGEGM